MPSCVQGGGGWPAGHPGRRRCAPGRATAARAGAGGGARSTVTGTGSCAPRPRGDIHRPAGPGSAAAPRDAQLSAARPRLSRCAPLRSKLLWRPVGNCGRGAPCGWGAARRGLLGAFPGQQPLEPRRSRRWCGCGCGALRRVGTPSHTPGPAGVLERVKRPLSWRGAVLASQTSGKKVWLSASSSRSPAESGGGGGGGGGGRRHRRRWARGSRARAVLGGCGVPR